MSNKLSTKTGFTLVELVISLAIFSIMTALVVARYGSFNQGILLTNLAYDIALTLRTAQSYGLNVKSVRVGTDTNFVDSFAGTYGVHFSSQSGSNTTILFFADNGFSPLSYDKDDTTISTLTIKRGSYVKVVCTGSYDTCSTSPDTLDVLFKRPDPNAIITSNAASSPTYPYAEIHLLSTDGGTKKIVVNRVGQITVSD